MHANSLNSFAMLAALHATQDCTQSMACSIGQTLLVEKITCP